MIKKIVPKRTGEINLEDFEHSGLPQSLIEKASFCRGIMSVAYKGFLSRYIENVLEQNSTNEDERYEYSQGCGLSQVSGETELFCPSSSTLHLLNRRSLGSPYRNVGYFLFPVI